MTRGAIGSEATRKLASARVALAFLLGLVLVACHGPALTAPGSQSSTTGSASATSPDASSDATASVTSSGFSLDVGPVTVSAPGGVASEGATVRVREISAPSELGEADIEVVGGVYDISLDDGSQPQVPVTIEYTDEVDPSASPLAFLTKPSGGEEWEGIPVAHEGSGASVELDHFSTFGFFRSDSIWSGLLMKGYALTDPPDCYGKSATVHGVVYSASTSSSFVFPCVVEVDGEAQLRIYNGSPYVWRYNAVDGMGPLSVPRLVPPTIVSVDDVKAALFIGLVTGPKKTGLDSAPLTPGSYLPVELALTSGSATIQGSMDAGLSTFVIVTGALAEVVIGKLAKNVSVTAEKLYEHGRCVADIVAQNPAVDAYTLGKTIGTILTSCIVPLATSLGMSVTQTASAAIGIITSLGPAAMQLSMGIPASLENGGSASVEVTAQPLAEQVERAEFTLPSNPAVHCVLSPGGAQCTTRHAVYSDPDASCGTGYPDGPPDGELQNSAVLEEKVSLGCDSDGLSEASSPSDQSWWDETDGSSTWVPYVTDPQVPNELANLPSGTALRAGDYLCTSDGDQVDCSNVATGAGFRMDDETITFRGAMEGVSENPAEPDYSDWDYTD
ncbi:hypothetical protein BRM3_09800 [Brachybacterium huguangmaarense]|uniref:Ig-like domain-containing protein n=1 Tax=Brachybacterium huguangmaarense TaxID=1652028 RepID=A0ABY6FYB4_9MICO|nr:hypothetical protein [Brachybacterium huguangmaarense]UYG15929.1 hypothetical protein BRM3_09800 [Brachybacterium huguangmaarense]